MNDIKTIVRLLTAIRASEEQQAFNIAYIDADALNTDEKTRDILAVKLQKEGLIDGLQIIDDIDNQLSPVVLWNRSKPSITLKGIEYMSENSAVRKALQELRNDGVALAGSIISSMMGKYW